MGDRQASVNFFNQAVSALGDHQNPQRKEHAFKLFVSACQADPTYGEAFYQNGCNLWDYKLTDASVASFRRALECELPVSLRAKALCNLGWQLHTLGKEEEARTASIEALRLDPSLIVAWVNLAMIEGIVGNSHAGLEAAQHAYELEQSKWDERPEDPMVEMALAFSYLFLGRFVEGFKHFEARFPYKLRNYLNFPYEKWRGEPDKTVFLVADQGLGDTISFSRFVDAAAKRCKFMHILIQPSCMRLFQHAFMHLPNVNLLPDGSPFPPADFWTTFVSLPYALGLNEDEIRNAPNVDYPRWDLPKSWKNQDAKLHVGIAWAGSPLNLIDEHRNIPVLRFLDLCKIEGVQLYSLQISDRKNDMHNAGCAALIRDVSMYVSDITDTLSLLRELDLVITCESALGHISALADKETWVPYSYLGRDYRLGLSGADEERLWSPRHRVFKQGKDLSWGPVFQEIEEALREKVDERAHRQVGQESEGIGQHSRPKPRIGIVQHPGRR